MSPFSQLGSALGGNSIDRGFSPVLRYIDEFDRHFSHRHRFMNCFIPRFDCEEDSYYYYLWGELPGAKVDDIAVEAHGENTLVVYGRTHRPYSLAQGDSHQEHPRSEGSKIPIHDNEKKGVPASEDGNTYINVDASDAGKPTGEHAPAAPNEKPNPHHNHPNRLVEHEDSENEAKKARNEHRTLLSERLVGEFHRTFNFPCPISEEGVKASMENGVLQLVVPKIEEKKRGRRIHIGRNEQPGAGL